MGLGNVRVWLLAAVCVLFGWLLLVGLLGLAVR